MSVYIVCFRRSSAEDEDDEGEGYGKRGRPTGAGGVAGVSFTQHDVERSAGDATSRPADSTERSRKPNLMSFPSMEHLDRMNDGSPWRDTSRRRRKFRGGIGGLHRRRGDTTERTDDDADDEVELDRVDDGVQSVPDTARNRRPARTTSGVNRSASAGAAARQRDRQQQAAVRGAQPTPEPPAQDNRIYRPVKKAQQSQPQPLPPPPLAPRPPAPVDHDKLRVQHAAEHNSEGDTSDSRPRRQRRRRQRADAETVPQASTEPHATAEDRQQPRVHQQHRLPQAPTQPHATAVDEPTPRFHQRQNEAENNVGHDAATDGVVPVVKPEAEVVSRGERRRTSRRAADSQPAARRTEIRTATVV